MHWKIPRSGCTLKLSNSKSSCKVAVLHILLKLRPPIASCRSADESTHAFQLLIPFLTCFTAGNGTAVQICQYSVRGQQKSTRCPSIVYDSFLLTVNLSTVIWSRWSRFWQWQTYEAINWGRILQWKDIHDRDTFEFAMYSHFKKKKLEREAMENGR